MADVKCQRCGETKPALTRPPYPDDFGRQVLTLGVDLEMHAITPRRQRADMRRESRLHRVVNREW